MCSAPSECFFHPRKGRCRLLQVWNGADFVDCRGRCVCPCWKLSIVIYILNFVCWLFFYFEHLYPKRVFAIYILNCALLFVFLRKSDLKRGNFGRPKQGQIFVVPTFLIHFLNPECVRIPWVLAPENFPVENFRVRSVLQKSSIFHWFLLPPPKKKYWARVPTILMPQTFPIASLNPYTPNF